MSLLNTFKLELNISHKTNSNKIYCHDLCDNPYQTGDCGVSYRNVRSIFSLPILSNKALGFLIPSSRTRMYSPC